jgi:quinohemoprotein ethanol dehydrogenase
MGRLGRSVIFLALISLALVTAITASGSRTKEAVTISIPAFSAAQDTAASGNDWISINGNLSSWRYDSLSQINQTTGANLKLAWTTTYAPPSPNPDANGIVERPTPPAGNPITYHGVTFLQDAWAHVDAIDGATGNIIWSFDPKWSFLNTTRNGVGTKEVISIGDGMVFTGEGGTVYALNAQTGTQIWATQIVDPSTGSLMSVPPVYYNGLLLDGVDGGDGGGPCFFVALNAKTGKPVWHFSPVPTKPSDPGWSTWPAKRAYWGGGGIWDPPTVDPTTGLVYFGTANPIPFTGDLAAPGAEEYTESLVALNAMTGKFVWGKQEVHHDLWDYDSNPSPILATGKINGKTVSFLWHINKDVYDYTYDPATGNYLVPTHEVPVPQDPKAHTYPTQPIPDAELPGGAGEIIPHVPIQPQAWTGLSPNGQPFVFQASPFVPFDHTIYSVSVGTGLSWNEQAYSPKTGLVYVCANFSEGAHSSLPPQDTHSIAGDGSLFGTLSASSPLFTGAYGQFAAINPTTLDVVWKYDTPGVNCSSQAMTTGGGLALVSTPTGGVEGFNDTTGALDWTLQTGSTTVPRFGFYGIGSTEYLLVTGTSNDATQPNGISYWVKAYTL